MPARIASGRVSASEEGVSSRRLRGESLPLDQRVIADFRRWRLRWFHQLADGVEDQNELLIVLTELPFQVVQARASST